MRVRLGVDTGLVVFLCGLTKLVDISRESKKKLELHNFIETWQRRTLPSTPNKRTLPAG